MTNLGLIDSNLLIYSFDRQSIFFEKAFEFIKKQVLEKNLIIPYPVIFEIYRILTEKIKKPLSSDKFWLAMNHYLKFARILFPTEKTLRLIKKLSQKYQIAGIDIFDLHIVALALENNIKVVYTHNQRDFAKFNEIKVIDPLI